jgi:sigma-B regulation protein RsbU (phosphoserine phosphatase)
LVRFRDLSIRSKLITGFMLTSLVALLITTAALALYDRTSFRRQILSDVDVLAGVIGENASSTIAFNDRQAAQSTLSALRAQPHIRSAYLFDSEGKQFASYPPGAPVVSAPGIGAVIGERALSVTRPVLFNGARVGTVYLQSDLGALLERRKRYLQLAAIVLIGATFIALLLSSAFQRVISGPILRLLDVEKRVSRDKDYSLRATKEGDDEVGMLIDGFNEMLSEIRARDAEILEKHDQEMALARTIQTSVLPKAFDLPGYDISAVMLPAEEVGGDFYEFRRDKEGAWLGVGDVTGHGVTSGLIMMMAQSMFTAFVEQGNGKVTPAKFLSLLNRAMFYNLKARLAQDKFMTMVVARIEAGGRMVYAGAHTDLLVYRAKKRTIDRIPTDGLWLGIAEDIEPMTSEKVVMLENGDVALFHTDGVTEARNAAGECFDMDRLSDQLLELHDQSASTIVTSIAEMAWKWAGKPKDDVSLMAVRKLG